MTAQELRATIANPQPPVSLDPLLAALWWEAKGQWSRAHEIAQDIESPEASWVHAYLHRKEGDASNAGYWYRRAGKPHARQAPDAEWDDIAHALLTTETA